MGDPILVVDDNPLNVKLMRVLLLGAGFDVRTAGDAEVAMQILSEFRPKLILMDVQLPHMDGFELTRLLKGIPELQDVKIIAITAYAMKGDHEKALAAGCDGYIAKPIDTRTLPQTIADYISGARP